MIKIIHLFLILLVSSTGFSQQGEWIQAEGEITEINFHQGKVIRETALIKFKLENGEEQFGSVELFRIPFIGSMKSVGDSVSIHYNKANPAILKTGFGKLLSDYGMYVLILLGIVFSIKPFLKATKKAQPNS